MGDTSPPTSVADWWSKGLHRPLLSQDMTIGEIIAAGIEAVEQAFEAERAAGNKPEEQ